MLLHNGVKKHYIWNLEIHGASSMIMRDNRITSIQAAEGLDTQRWRAESCTK